MGAPKFNKYSLTFELFWDASKHDTVEVEAKTLVKAIQIGTEILKKKYKTDIVNFKSHLSKQL